MFVTRHNSEGSEASLEMVGNQDALVSAVAKANPKTIVVAETGGAIYMPWIGQVPAILEAFYPGIRGGAAIARILTGKVNPSGHLPISFPGVARPARAPGHCRPRRARRNAGRSPLRRRRCDRVQMV